MLIHDRSAVNGHDNNYLLILFLPGHSCILKILGIVLFFIFNLVVWMILMNSINPVFTLSCPMYTFCTSSKLIPKFNRTRRVEYKIKSLYSTRYVSSASVYQYFSACSHNWAIVRSLNGFRFFSTMKGISRYLTAIYSNLHFILQALLLVRRTIHQPFMSLSGHCPDIRHGDLVQVHPLYHMKAPPWVLYSSTMEED